MEIVITFFIGGLIGMLIGRSAYKTEREKNEFLKEWIRNKGK